MKKLEHREGLTVKNEVPGYSKTEYYAQSRSSSPYSYKIDIEWERERGRTSPHRKSQRRLGDVKLHKTTETKDEKEIART